MPQTVAHLDAIGWCWVIVSCVVGVCISYTGIWAQSLISATSFLVLVNANKFGIIFVEAVFMSKKVSGTQLLGAGVTIFGGILYGQAREHAEREQEKERTAEA